jgi:tetratricopeptide (TPR) repeat protein
MTRPFLTMFGVIFALGAFANTANADVDSYEDCLDLIIADPIKAEVQALNWFDRTGEPGALHCEALALSARNAHGPAAQRFASLASSQAMDSETRATLLLQSAEEWKAFGDLVRARETLNQGLKIHETADLFAERAIIQIAEGHEQAARYDMDRALTLRPKDPALMTQRAEVKRRLGDAQGARADAAGATVLEPDSPEAWLELGLAEQALGQNNLAREAWFTAIQANPDSPAARLARGALQDMDGG